MGKKPEIFLYEIEDYYADKPVTKDNPENLNLFTQIIHFYEQAGLREKAKEKFYYDAYISLINTNLLEFSRHCKTLGEQGGDASHIWLTLSSLFDHETLPRHGLALDIIKHPLAIEENKDQTLGHKEKKRRNEVEIGRLLERESHDVYGYAARAKDEVNKKLNSHYSDGKLNGCWKAFKLYRELEIKKRAEAARSACITLAREMIAEAEKVVEGAETIDQLKTAQTYINKSDCLIRRAHSKNIRTLILDE